MQPPILISDYRVGDAIAGGSECVNETVIQALGCEFIRTRDIKNLDRNRRYIVANLSTARTGDIVAQLSQCRYVILEHDCKFLASRHPWRYPNSVAPQEHIINRDLYKNALATFVQTAYHLEVFKKNGIAGRFYNLESGIWSEREIKWLTALHGSSTIRHREVAILDSPNWIKNKDGAIKFCEANNIDYILIGDPNWDRFMDRLSHFSTLVFFPLAGETLCRLVVEARCIGLNVITTKNYGATLSSWYKHRGTDLLQILTVQSSKNLEAIRLCLAN